MQNNKDNSKFKKISDEGVEIYSKWLRAATSKNEDYTFELLQPVDEYSPYDLMQIKRNIEDYSEEATQYIEIKIRNIDIDSYEDCLIDEDKIFKLQKLSMNTGYKVFLAAIYKANKKIVLWEIDTENAYETREVTALWHTKEPQLGKKLKKMCVFPLKDGKVYSYQ